MTALRHPVDQRVDRKLLRMVADGDIDKLELPVYESIMEIAAKVNKAYYEMLFSKKRSDD